MNECIENVKNINIVMLCCIDDRINVQKQDIEYTDNNNLHHLLWFNVRIIVSMDAM